MRAGELSPAHVQWAARLGHPLAQTLSDAAPDAGPGAVQRCLEAELLTPDQRHRFALDCVQRVMPILGRSLPSQVVPQALSALSRGPSLISDLASVLPNLPPLSRQRSSVVFQCYRAVRAALEGDAPAASQAAVFARRAEDQPEELEWQREHLAELLLE